MIETAEDQKRKRLLAKLEEFQVIAAQCMNMCESIQKELRGESN